MKRLLVLTFVLFFSAAAYATDRDYVGSAHLFETITVPGGTTTVTRGTSTVRLADASRYANWKAMYTISGGPIGFRFDSGATSLGTSSCHVAYDGDVIVLDSLSDIQNFTCAQMGSASTSLSITYSRGHSSY